MATSRMNVMLCVFCIQGEVDTIYQGRCSCTFGIYGIMHTTYWTWCIDVA